MWILDELKKLKDSEKLAMIYRESQITFRELWERSEKIADYINRTCKTKNPIVIYGNKEIDIITVMIASLKTGRAYSPVDISYPTERLNKIASITECELLVNFSNETEGLPSNVEVIDQGKLDFICSSENTEFDESNYVKDDDICYILFTSGSTGEPKGVQISKKNIECFTSYFKSDCYIGNGQVVLNQPPYSFDLSVINPYVCLAMGKTLYNIDKRMIETPREMFEYFKKSDISLWVSTPSFLTFCIFDDSFNSSLFPNMKKFIFNGEFLPKKLVKTIFEKFPNATVINAYGPTEATVGITSCPIIEEMLKDEKDLPIGKLSPNVSCEIIDESGKKLGDNQTGELVIEGNSVSKGYYKDEERTKISFFKNSEGKQCYRTGDLVFKSGEYFYFVSRKDFQIKLNGFRIELDDIASNLNKIKYIKGSVAIPVYKDKKISHIAAFVTVDSESIPKNVALGIQIKNDLKKLVPSYMVPRKIKVLDKFPLNVNGKIDRKKLMGEL